MENSLFYCLIIFLIFASCKHKNENKSIEEGEIVANSQTTDTLPPCFSSYQIYKEAAVVWQASWVAFYNEYGTENKNYTHSPYLYFDENSLDTLYSEVSDKKFPGVLLWYILLPGNDSIPSLAMQNTTSCIIDEGGTILMSLNSGEKVEEISQDSLDSYKKNWEATSAKSPSVHTPIQAYNYSWDSIRSLIALDSLTLGIYISYGLRTIEPNELGYEQGNETFRDTTKAGSVVYCNVLSDSEPGSGFSSTLVDFAMPCPQFCGEIN